MSDAEEIPLCQECGEFAGPSSWKHKIHCSFHPVNIYISKIAQPDGLRSVFFNPVRKCICRSKDPSCRVRTCKMKSFNRSPNGT